MPKQSPVLEIFNTAKREEALETARALLERLGEPAKAEIMSYLATLDTDFVLQRIKKGEKHLSLVTNNTLDDLKALGIEIPENPRFIVESDTSPIPEVQINPEELSQKELELWMARYFKDTEARKKIIELFWGENPAYSRDKKDFTEVAREISDVLNVPKQEEQGQTLVSSGKKDISLVEKRSTVDNLYHAGTSIAEVRRKKRLYGIANPSPKESAKIIKLELWRRAGNAEATGSYANDSKHSAKLIDAGQEFYERYRNWQADQIQAYIESEFSYCVFAIFQSVDTLIWFSKEAGDTLSVPPKIQQKLDLIQSLAEVHGLYDYGEHFESALKAFIAYYLPKFKHSVKTYHLKRNT